MPFDNQELELITLKQEFALKKIQEDLAAFANIQIIQTLLYQVKIMRLTYIEGNQPDINKIDNFIRTRLLSLDFANMEDYDRKLHQTVFNCLILLGNYWPHNAYEYDSESDDYVFKCAYSFQRITPENKLILPSGTQLDKTVLKDYINFSKENSFKDPIGQTQLDLNTVNYLCSAENKSWWQRMKTLIPGRIFTPRPIYDADYKTKRNVSITSNTLAGVMIAGCVLILAMTVAAALITLASVNFPPFVGWIFLYSLLGFPVTGGLMGAAGTLYRYYKSESADLKRVLPAEELHKTFNDNVSSIELQAFHEREILEYDRTALANQSRHKQRSASASVLPSPDDAFWLPVVPVQKSVQSEPPAYTSLPTSTAVVSQQLNVVEEQIIEVDDHPPSYSIAMSPTAAAEIHKKSPATKTQNDKREEWLKTLESRTLRSGLR
jgi:hypothetical protein